LRTFKGHLRSVCCVEISSNERILSGSKEKTIKIWNIQTGDCLVTLDEHLKDNFSFNVFTQEIQSE
jgi:WD40 repeat protein